MMGLSRKLKRNMAMPLLVAVLLICCIAAQVIGQQQQIQTPNACLRAAFTSGLKDKTVFSQVGEDGILEAIFNCIGARSRYYVEFGTEDGNQCSTRLLREQKGWMGLLLDGGYRIPEINLHQEMITAEDIVQVFEKYAVPKPMLVRKQLQQGTLQHLDPQEQQRQEALHQEFLRQQQLLRQTTGAQGATLQQVDNQQGKGQQAGLGTTASQANVQDLLQHGIQQAQQLQQQVAQVSRVQEGGVLGQQQQQQQQQQASTGGGAGTSATSSDLEDRQIGRRRLAQVVEDGTSKPSRQLLQLSEDLNAGGELGEWGLQQQQQAPMTQEQQQQQQQKEEMAAAQREQLQLQERHMAAMGQHRAHMRLDQLTVDIDMNTFWVLREILQAGYRPRSLTAEFNRNLGPDLSFASVYMPKENWQIDDVGEDTTERSMRATCYFGASAVALNRLTAHYGYVPVAIDVKGVNLFYVHNSTVGGVPVFTWEEVVANVDNGLRARAKEQHDAFAYDTTSSWDSTPESTPTQDTWSDPYVWNPLLLNTTWSSLHSNCHDSVWLEVKKDLDFSHGDRLFGHGHPSHFARQMRPILLRHEPIEGTTHRRFYQPRGVPRFGWVDAPEGVEEEQYWAPEHPEQPSVQLRLQLKARQEAEAESQWQTDAFGQADFGSQKYGGGHDWENEDEKERNAEDHLDEYGDEQAYMARRSPTFRRQKMRQTARVAQAHNSNSYSDNDGGYFGDSSFDDEGEGTFPGGGARRRGQRGRRRGAFSPVADMRGVLSSLHLAAAFLFGIMASLLVSMLARRNRGGGKIGTLPSYRVKS